MNKDEETNFDPRARLAQAALGVLAKDPAFQARYPSGAEADPPKAEDRAEADPDAPADEEETPADETAVPPTDALEARLAKLEKMAEDRQTFITQLQNENAELRARAATPSETEVEEVPDAIAELEQYGVPPETVRKAIIAEATKVVQAYFAPMVQVAEAEKALSADPIYAEHAPKLEAFVRENKEIADTVLALANAGKIQAAKRYAWDSYKIAKAAEIEAPKKAAAAAQAVERASKKKDAGIAPTQKAESRTPKDDRAETDAKNLAAAQRDGSSKAVGRYISGALFPKRPQ